MAAVWLDRRAWQEGDVPNVCLRCGGPAPDRVRKVFYWTPYWVYLLIFINLLVMLIVALALRKKRTTWVPLCEKHKGHWRRRQLFIWGSLAGIVAVVVLSGVLVSQLGDPDGAGVIVAMTVLGLLAWVICAIVAQSTAIRATEFSKREIHLAGVSEEFVDAYEADLEEEAPPIHNRADLDKAVRQRWSERQIDREGSSTKDGIREDPTADGPSRTSDRYRRE
jgi:hypothetical protein